MPYKDEQTQREADKFYHKRLRAKRKLEAEARNEKFIEEIPETAENLNYGMKATPEKPMTWEEFLEENPKADKTEWIQYKIKFSYEHKWKMEKETEDKRKAREEREHFQTREHPCILWRRMYEKGQKCDFYYNHIDSCHDCMKWYAKQKDRSALDLNETKGKNDHFPELDGYASMFAEPKPYPEDYIYSPFGTFPMNKMCPNCLSNLRPDGTCPNCQPD